MHSTNQLSVTIFRKFKKKYMLQSITNQLYTDQTLYSVSIIQSWHLQSINSSQTNFGFHYKNATTKNEIATAVVNKVLQYVLALGYVTVERRKQCRQESPFSPTRSRTPRTISISYQQPTPFLASCSDHLPHTPTLSLSISPQPPLDTSP